MTTFKNDVEVCLQMIAEKMSYGFDDLDLPAQAAYIIRIGMTVRPLVDSTVDDETLSLYVAKRLQQLSLEILNATQS